MSDTTLSFMSMAELERPEDVDRVSKRELVERNVRLRKHLIYTVVQLFKADAGNRYFESLSGADRERLLRIKLSEI